MQTKMGRVQEGGGGIGGKGSTYPESETAFLEWSVDVV